jgi:hypothetical protein
MCGAELTLHGSAKNWSKLRSFLSFLFAFFAPFRGYFFLSYLCRLRLCVILTPSPPIASMLRQTLIVTSFALFASAPLLGGCIPSTTPDPAASAAAQTEMKAFEPFLREPLCEQIAVRYQLATDYAAVGNVDKTIELAQESGTSRTRLWFSVGRSI